MRSSVLLAATTFADGLARFPQNRAVRRVRHCCVPALAGRLSMPAGFHQHGAGGAEYVPVAAGSCYQTARLHPRHRPPGSLRSRRLGPVLRESDSGSRCRTVRDSSATPSVRFQIRSYRRMLIRRQGGLQFLRKASGSDFADVGRTASWASWAFFALVRYWRLGFAGRLSPVRNGSPMTVRSSAMAVPARVTESVRM